MGLLKQAGTIIPGFQGCFSVCGSSQLRKSMSKLSSEISHEKPQSRNTHQILLSNCDKKSEKAEILLEAPLSQKLSSLVLLMKESFRWKGPVTLPFLISLPLFEFIVYLEQNLVRIFLLIVPR